MVAKVKLKSRAAFAKRFKAIGNGKLKRKRANTSHLFGNKSSRQKKSSRKPSYLSKSDLKRVRKMVRL